MIKPLVCAFVALFAASLSNAQMVDVPSQDVAAPPAVAVPEPQAAETETEVARPIGVWRQQTPVANAIGSAADLSAGVFGANAGGGIFSFASNVGVGTSNPVSGIHLLNNYIAIESQSDASIWGIAFRRTRGGPGSVASVADGDATGFLGFNGWDGAAYRGNAAIRAEVDGTPSSGSIPGRLTFQVANGSGALVERMRITSNGYVGVGTAAPSYPLSVVSTSPTVTAAVAAQLSPTFTANVNQAIVAVAPTVQPYVSAGVANSNAAYGVRSVAQVLGGGTLSNVYGLDAVASVSPTATATVSNAFGARLRVMTSAPSGTGTIALGYGLYIDDVEATTPYGIYVNGIDDHNFVAGRLGIGGRTWQAAGRSRLDVSDVASSSGASRVVARLMDETNPAVGTGAGLDLLGKFLAGDNAQTNFSTFANIKGVKKNATSGDREGEFVVSAGNAGGTTVEVARFGVGNTALTGTLAVSGATNISGNLTVTGDVTGARVFRAVYQDLAEWVPASEDMPAGTVVVIDPTTVNRVMPSDGEYDTRVAGVVSAQPGLVLGVEAATKEQVATTGRVRVRVDATRAPIQIGDLLVTSSKAGVAMRSMPVDVAGIQMHRPGTVIGKALEPLASGEGEILVLLSLQ